MAEWRDEKGRLCVGLKVEPTQTAPKPVSKGKAEKPKQEEQGKKENE